MYLSVLHLMCSEKQLMARNKFLSYRVDDLLGYILIITFLVPMYIQKCPSPSLSHQGEGERQNEENCWLEGQHRCSMTVVHECLYKGVCKVSVQRWLMRFEANHNILLARHYRRDHSL